MSSFPEGNGTARHVLYVCDRAMLGARNASQGGWLRKTRSDRATGRKAQAHEPNLPMTNTLVLQWQKVPREHNCSRGTFCYCSSITMTSSFCRTCCQVILCGVTRLLVVDANSASVSASSTIIYAAILRASWRRHRPTLYIYCSKLES